MYDWAWDAADIYVWVQSFFFGDFVFLFFGHPLRRGGGVADLLGPSSSLLHIRGTASTSPVPPCYVLQRYIYRGQQRSWFRRAGPPPASPSFVVLRFLAGVSL